MPSAKKKPQVRDDDVRLYEQLVKKGLPCGVHDPDFASPLEASLHYDVPHGIGARHMLRLECEDTTLNFTRVMREVTAEAQSGMYSGHGAVLIDASKGSATLAVLVIDSEEDRSCLLRVLALLREDTRVFRRKKPVFACLPTASLGACLPVCRGKMPAGEPGDEPLRKASADFGPAESMFGQNSPAPSREQSYVDAGSAPFGLESLRTHARKLWDIERQRAAGLRRSGSFIFRSSRGKSLEPQDLASSTPPATPARASALGPDELDVYQCLILLGRLCTDQDGPSLPSVSADLFSSPNGNVNFESFWKVCCDLLMFNFIWQETEDKGLLQKSFQSDPESSDTVMEVKKWQWFLVQVQDEERETVERAAKDLPDMVSPEVDDSGHLTLYGFVKQMCSQANSVFCPARCSVNQDMTRPLTDYWIATSHHIYQDALKQQADLDESLDPEIGSPLLGIRVALQAKCRCLHFVLVSKDEVQASVTPRSGSSRPLRVTFSDAGANSDVCVLLQHQCVPLEDVLNMLKMSAIQEDTDYPLVLVFNLSLLSPAVCARVPEVLTDCLGELLWKASQERMPSPEDAKGHVFVALAPCPARPTDDSWALLAGYSSKSRSTDNGEAFNAWTEAAKRLAIWQGFELDLGRKMHPSGEVTVGFVLADDFLALEPKKLSQLAEGLHQEHLTAVQPLSHRRASSSYNPAVAWAAGAQMAALNFRSEDCTGCWGRSHGGALAHLARFAQDNGGCGYVLKPPHMLSQKGQPASSAPAPLKMEVRILAARAVPGLGTSPNGWRSHALCSSKVELAISIFGIPSDCGRHQFEPVRPDGPVFTWTKTVNTSGATSRSASFLVASPSTALLCFEVLQLDALSGGRRRVAAFGAPVDGLRQGIRWVPLWATSDSGAPRATVYGSLSGLLVHTVIERKKR
eukprot:TRINITY_DN121724_c0_g1_i1.p1 TRINITY_DN121724_c0_g1~~TRINITY_DN121724_c0_g1_i1.p1  ORF type:complete len:916 (-),score=94.83 TRINITY_DN121724_c0_g1_i1:67-2814(-)